MRPLNFNRYTHWLPIPKIMSTPHKLALFPFLAHYDNDIYQNNDPDQADADEKEGVEFKFECRCRLHVYTLNFRRWAITDGAVSAYLIGICLPIRNRSIVIASGRGHSFQEHHN